MANVVNSQVYQVEEGDKHLLIDSLYVGITNASGNVEYVPFSNVAWINNNISASDVTQADYRNFTSYQEFLNAKNNSDISIYLKDKKGEYGTKKFPNNAEIYSDDVVNSTIAYNSTKIEVSGYNLTEGLPRSVSFKANKLNEASLEENEDKAYIKVLLEGDIEPTFVKIADLSYSLGVGMPKPFKHNTFFHPYFSNFTISANVFGNRGVNTIYTDQFYLVDELLSYDEINASTMERRTNILNPNNYVQSEKGNFIKVTTAEKGEERVVNINELYSAESEASKLTPEETTADKLEGKELFIKIEDEFVKLKKITKEQAKERYSDYQVTANLDRYFSIQTPVEFEEQDGKKTKTIYKIKTVNYKASTASDATLLKVKPLNSDVEIMVDLADLFTKEDESFVLPYDSYLKGITVDGETKYVYDGAKLIGKELFAKVGEEFVKLEPLSAYQAMIRYTSLKSYQPAPNEAEDAFIKLKNGIYTSETNLVQPLLYAKTESSEFTHYLLEDPETHLTYVVDKNEFNKGNTISFTTADNKSVKLTKKETTPKLVRTGNINEADVIQTTTCGENTELNVNKCKPLARENVEERNTQINEARAECWKNYRENRTYNIPETAYDADGNKVEIDSDTRYIYTDVAYADDIAHEYHKYYSHNAVKISEKNGKTTLVDENKYSYRKSTIGIIKKTFKRSMRPCLVGLMSGGIAGVFVVAPLALAASIAVTAASAVITPIANIFVAAVKNRKDKYWNHKTIDNQNGWQKGLDKDLQAGFDYINSNELSEEVINNWFAQAETSLAKLSVSRFESELHFENNSAEVTENNAAAAWKYINERKRLEIEIRDLKKEQKKLDRSSDRYKEIEGLIFTYEQRIETLATYVNKQNFTAHERCAEFYGKIVKAKAFAETKNSSIKEYIENKLDYGLTPEEKKAILAGLSYDFKTDKIIINIKGKSLDKKALKALNKKLTKAVKETIFKDVTKQIDEQVEKFFSPDEATVEYFNVEEEVLSPISEETEAEVAAVEEELSAEEEAEVAPVEEVEEPIVVAEEPAPAPTEEPTAEDELSVPNIAKRVLEIARKIPELEEKVEDGKLKDINDLLTLPEAQNTLIQELHGYKTQLSSKSGTEIEALVENIRVLINRLLNLNFEIPEITKVTEKNTKLMLDIVKQYKSGDWQLKAFFELFLKKNVSYFERVEKKSHEANPPAWINKRIVSVADANNYLQEKGLTKFRITVKSERSVTITGEQVEEDVEVLDSTDPF